MTVWSFEVVEQRLQRVAGALERREARADDGAEHHPVARLAVVHLVGDEQQHRALAELLDQADGDERAARRGQEVGLQQRGRRRRPACRRARKPSTTSSVVR